MTVPRWDFIPLDNPVHGITVYTGPHRGDEGNFVLYDDHVADKAEATRPIMFADAVSAHEWDDGYAAGLTAQPRTLTADSPEPAVGSVVLDALGRAWQREREGWRCVGFWSHYSWDDLWSITDLDPLRLIHDGGQAPNAAAGGDA